MTAAVLAVDGGNSKTDVVLVSAGGEVLSHVQGASTSPHRAGSAEAAFDLLDELVAEAAGGSSRGVADVAAVYLAGADTDQERADLTAAAGRRGWGNRAYVENDTMALLRTGTDAPDAVAVVCGAGINAVGVRADGAEVRYAALGRESGDWGGGQELGDEALWYAARHEDGRGQPTSLTGVVAHHFGLPSAAAVGEAVFRGRLDRERLAELAPAVLREAAAGDEVAASVVARLADEVVLFAVTTLRRLDLLGRAATVVLGGGVLAAADRLLLDTVVRQLAEGAPLAQVEVVRQRPVLGAALAGLRVAGAPPEAGRRLREAFATAVPGAALTPLG